ncbi:Alpha/Beta hydrolase protein [Xylogone sp. PMI_703]|nr:Alpha/Beta hydrolase protein [Xylogone sp. PMI_703]
MLKAGFKVKMGVLWLSGIDAALLINSCFVQSTSTSKPSHSSLQVDLGYVKYKGAHLQDTDVNVFHGIHYAQPPMGELRWRKPASIEEKNTYQGRVIDASQFGPNCPQMVPPTIPAALPAVVNDPSEDCLSMDIYVPAHPVSKALPVIVNLHGGGYTLGGSARFPGDGIVYESKGQMIYVVVQYRLGLFGFLAGSEVIENGEANTGLLDQRAALMWIQRHIASFGGDPSRVTIYGASAGGGSVLYQLLANGGSDTPPFSAAIAELPWVQPLMNASSQNIQYREILKLANVSGLAGLRSLDTGFLQKINQQHATEYFPSPGYGQGVFDYGPVVDGKFIRQLPSEALKQGNFYRVPLLTDHDAYEGFIFSNPNTTTQVAETLDARSLFPYAKPSFYARLYNLYPRSDFNSTFWQRQTWFGDVVVNCPTYYAAKAFTDLAQNSSAVFKLVFSAGNQLHGATSPFIFPSGRNWEGVNNQTIANIMTNYFISFVVAHDPNPLRWPEAPFWHSYLDAKAASVDGSGTFNVMSVTYNSIGNTPDPDAGPRCDFLYGQSYALSN